VTEENIFRFITVDEYAVTPKYLQLANSIVKAIEKELIGKGYLLPSINELSFELDISRDTAEKAYRHLKKMGIIGQGVLYRQYRYQTAHPDLPALQ